MRGPSTAVLLALLYFTSCGAVGWLLSPATPQPDTNPTEPGIQAPAVPVGPTRLDVAVDVASGVGGVLTGTPVVWTLFAQAAHLLVGGAASLYNKRKTQAAPCP